MNEEELKERINKLENQVMMLKKMLYKLAYCYNDHAHEIGKQLVFIRDEDECKFKGIVDP